MMLYFPSQTKLQVVATERDFAVSQMKEMAEQVQSIAGEFKSMADHCARVMKELEQVHICSYHVQTKAGQPFFSNEPFQNVTVD